MLLDTDYLVVGAGLAGMGFVDALLDANQQATAVIVDRRHAPGGHWLDCYPFVRLHQPSHLYGVASTPLGQQRILQHGPFAGRYESASGAEICGYFDQVMQHRLLPSDRVRFLPRHEYLGNGRVRSLDTGKVTEVAVRKRTVDATYMCSRVPGDSPPPFEVAEGVRCVAAGLLPKLDEAPEGYVLIGAGKTAIDTCLWLLDQGIEPERIRWVRPRDMWLLHRNHFEGGKHVDRVVEGAVKQFEAAATTDSVDAFFEHCEGAGVMLRIDRNVRPTMFRGSTCEDYEVERAASVEQVIRMGHVKRIEKERVVLAGGSVPTSTGHVHVHCAAKGLPDSVPLPIFQEDLITLQWVRQGSPSFSFALIGLVEGSERDDAERNRLLPPNGSVSTPLDWVRATLQASALERSWRKESDIDGWRKVTRLNLACGSQDLVHSPHGPALFERLTAAGGPGVAGMQRMLGEATEAERRLFWPPVGA